MAARCLHGRTVEDDCHECRIHARCEDKMYSTNGRSLATPGRSPKLWRGWRDQQPQRNPVTVKRVGE